METASPRAFRIEVEGMHCAACEKLVGMHLAAVSGVHSVSADAQAGTVDVVVDSDVDLSALEAG
ncbi:cation transporter, partial [bacterium]|nr:cation transporter [bacterium]